jgi:hypothetical protein
MLSLPAKFEVGDAVRFIGTSTAYTITQYNAESLEYRVQCGDDSVSSQWVLGVYLEPVQIANPQAAD